MNTTIEIIILAFIMNADAFSLMTIKGASLTRVKAWQVFSTASLLALWQSLVLYFSASFSQHFIQHPALSHPVYLEATKGFAILFYLLLGFYFIYKSRQKVGIEETAGQHLDLPFVISAAGSTSIDAAIIGVSLSLRQINFASLLPYCLIVTFVSVIAGILWGRYFGPDWYKNPQLLAGISFIILARCI